MLEVVKQKRITKEELLSRVSEESIYNMYAGPFIEGRAKYSPFRKESRPSFSIWRNSKGKLRHKDHGNDEYSGDCIDFVMQKFSLSFQEALDKINRDFSGVVTYRPKIERAEPTKPKVITPKVRPYNNRDLVYWEQYGISKEVLEREEIFSVESYSIEGKEYVVGDELCFGYKFEEGWKIYFPMRTNFKWFSSVPNTVLEWGEIKHRDYLIITKSRKDRLVLSSIVPNVANCQNESRSLLTEDNLKLIKLFKKVYLLFDSDAPGIRAAEAIAEEMGWTNVHITGYDDVKDPAELVSRVDNGREILKGFLNNLLTQ